MQPITFEELVFSNKPSIRITRHFLFWFLWWLYFGLLHAANPFGSKEISYFRNMPFAMSESILLMVPQALITYCILYVAFPLAIKRRYLIAGSIVVAAYWLGAIVNYYLVVDFGPNILAWLLPEEYMRYTPRPEAVGFFMALMNTFKGGLVSSALAVSLKAMKSWREREMRNLELQREKADAQLQLLTAQIHPHFLFNTINNIYSQTQTESPKGSEMIMELSDLLRYILYEGRKAQVPLDRELQMLVDYVNLEKIRYGNSLEVHLDLPERTNDLWIAPLMLLPFIENCFKHGASRQLHRPWISLTIEITDDTMIMNLSNGRSGDPEKKKEGGIGIRNVRNRLGLLYPNAHQLHIEDKPDVFAVKLEIKLSKGTELHQAKKERNAVEEAIYAE